MKLPSINDRVTVVGRTGSGKTQHSLWLLSFLDFIKNIPVIMIDTKRDKLIDKIPYRKKLPIDNSLPDEPGIYVVEADVTEPEKTEALLNRIYQHENICLFIDEGFNIPKNSPSFIRILTQGRSKQIPVITLIQRPVSVSLFVFSEASFINIFQLVHPKDKERIREFVGEKNIDRLADYHSLWYDVSKNTLTPLKPAPSIDIIYNKYELIFRPKKEAMIFLPEENNSGHKPKGKFV